MKEELKKNLKEWLNNPITILYLNAFKYERDNLVETLTNKIITNYRAANIDNQDHEQLHRRIYASDLIISDFEALFEAKKKLEEDSLDKESLEVLDFFINNLLQNGKNRK